MGLWRHEELAAGEQRHTPFFADMADPPGRAASLFAVTEGWGNTSSMDAAAALLHQASPSPPVSLAVFGKACGGVVTAVMMGTNKCYLTLGRQAGARHQRTTTSSYPLQEHYVHKFERARVAKDNTKNEWKEWRRVTRIPEEGKIPPARFIVERHEIFLSTLLAQLDSFLAEARTVLSDVVKTGHVQRNAVVALALTQGDLDLLVNFACSLRRAGMDPGTANIVVFGGDEEVVSVAKSLGFHAFTHAVVKEVPAKHAAYYGDAIFLDVMWLKTLAAWVVSRCGYDVLFQDVDVVWFQDPLSFFLDPAQSPPETDGFFMDDGARSERFSPYPANSGFFFLRHNPRTQHMLQSMLFLQDLVIQWGSHQSVFIQTLEAHLLRHGLTVQILSKDLFPGGYIFHHEKDKLDDVREGRLRPFMFHMNWTAFKKEKLENFAAAGMWYNDQCGVEDLVLSIESSAPTLTLDQCCLQF